MVIGIDASRAFVSDKTGTENYSYHLITEILRLPESRQHLFVLFTRPNAMFPSELAGYDNVIVKIINFRYLWTQVGLAIETWREPKLDLLWIPAHTLPVLRSPKVKTVVTIHGLEYKWLSEYKNWLQRWYLPLSTYYAARSADTIIAVSHFTAQELQKEVHNISKKIKVIYEGVASAPRRSDTVSLQKYGLLNKQYVLFVGTVQPRKNLVALIEAFAKTKISPEVKLVIAGGIGWEAEEVLRAARKYGIPERVVFTGRVSEAALAELYSHALVYVQPSVTEGFGLPILEAMVHDVPVITSDGGALKEVVGDSGIVVPLGGQFVKELAQAIAQLVGSETTRAKLIKRGQKRVGEFGWDKVAKLTLRALLNIR